MRAMLWCHGSWDSWCINEHWNLVWSARRKAAHIHRRMKENPDNGERRNISDILIVKSKWQMMLFHFASLISFLFGTFFEMKNRNSSTFPGLPGKHKVPMKKKNNTKFIIHFNQKYLVMINDHNYHGIWACDCFYDNNNTDSIHYITNALCTSTHNNNTISPNKKWLNNLLKKWFFFHMTFESKLSTNWNIPSSIIPIYTIIDDSYSILHYYDFYWTEKIKIK